jgi:hypothetical protein
MHNVRQFFKCCHDGANLDGEHWRLMAILSFSYRVEVKMFYSSFLQIAKSRKFPR